MKRTLTLVSALALMLSMLALPALALEQITEPDDHCPGANPNFPLPKDFSIILDNDTTEQFDQGERNDTVLPAGTYVCVKGGTTNATGIVVADGEKTLKEILGSGQDVSYFMTYNFTPPFTPDGAVSLSKDATASYDVDVTWELDKMVRQRGVGFGNNDLTNDLGLTGEPDDSFLLLWRIVATRTDGDPYNHTVFGEITVSNSSTNTAVTVDLADELSKMGAKVGDATVDCDGEGATSVTVAADGEETCSYTASPETAALLPDLNTVSGTATATDPVGYESSFPIEPATAEVSFTINYKGETNPLLADPEFELSENISETTTKNIQGEWVCPPERSELYEKDGIYVRTLTNTATLIGEDLNLKDSATVTLTCYDDVFESETAWAANDETAGEFRYTDRGNWATYVAYDGEKTTTLFAGQNIDVGSVDFSATVDGKITITVTLDEPWEFEDVAENLKVQGYTDAPSGNPAPGRFDHKTTCDAASSTCSIEVPAINFYGVHVNVGQWVPNPLLPS